jgi:Flp pilus assembly protein TadD
MNKKRQKIRKKTQQNIGLSARKVVSPTSKDLPKRSVSEFGRFTADRRIGLLMALLIIVCVMVSAAHWPALSARALSFDDENYLLNNQLVQNPSWNSTRRFLTEVLAPSTVKGYYQPLTMLSLMLDYALGGRPNNLLPFHITSLCLHVVNTSLVIVFLYVLFGKVWPAAIVGLLFGVHPVTVEPIPWIAERKTLLAAFFSLWCLILYVRFTRNRRPRFYIGCLIMYVLALISKPSALPLPFLVLLLDYWPLRRLNLNTILEKTPFFIICAISVVLAFISQSTFGVYAPGTRGLGYTTLVICHNIVLYLSNMVWPANLSLFYPYPHVALSDPKILTGVVGTAVLIVALLISLRWTRALLTGWLFFFVAIFPAIGIVGIHDMIAADRHAYLPFVGMLLPAAYFLSLFWDKVTSTRTRQAVTLIVVVILAGLEVLSTRRHLIYWKDTETHRRRMVALAPHEPIVHNSLGVVLYEQGKFDQAVMHYTEALRLRTGIEAAIHYNLANALVELGKFDEAIKNYTDSIRLEPNHPDTYNALGLALYNVGRFDEAVKYYEKAIALKPDFITAHGRLGLALAKQGKIDEAIKQLRIVLISRPDDVEMHCNLGILLDQQGKIAEAIEQYRRALQINPDYTKAGKRLEAALAKQQNHQ